MPWRLEHSSGFLICISDSVAYWANNLAKETRVAGQGGGGQETLVSAADGRVLATDTLEFTLVRCDMLPLAAMAG